MRLSRFLTNVTLFLYLDKDDEYLEEKMRRLAAILPHLEGMSGTLHLETYDENTENIIFDTTEAVKPEEIPQAAEQSAEGAEQSAEAAEGAGA